MTETMAEDNGLPETICPYDLIGGGVYIPEWIFCRKGLSVSAKVLYARMARYTVSGNHFCWPDQALLAEELDVTPKTIRALLAELTDVGLIRTERPGLGQKNRYFFLRHRWMVEPADGPTTAPVGKNDRTNNVSSVVSTDQDGSFLPITPSLLKNVLKELPSAGAESHGVSPIRVDTASLKKSRSKAQPRWVEPVEESAVLGAEVKAIPIHRKDSTAGLVFQFARMARAEFDDLGPTDLNDGALARVVRSWQQRGMSPEVILQTMETYLGGSPRRNGKPLWQSYAGAAEALYIRTADRIDSENTDYSRER